MIAAPTACRLDARRGPRQKPPSTVIKSRHSALTSCRVLTVESRRGASLLVRSDSSRLFCTSRAHAFRLRHGFRGPIRSELVLSIARFLLRVTAKHERRHAHFRIREVAGKLLGLRIVGEQVKQEDPVGADKDLLLGALPEPV